MSPEDLIELITKQRRAVIRIIDAEIDRWNLTGGSTKVAGHAIYALQILRKRIEDEI